jgi:hypothetical protein
MIMNLGFTHQPSPFNGCALIENPNGAAEILHHEPKCSFEFFADFPCWSDFNASL